ncbi:hypothetical protein K5X82_05720 [Halosquirtibacter xylanolyticus]|uniref:hypothetical protein n=1 Tax=Halosquirtibacter xylanolyticus TaxID=3374599 RepID=UPI003747F959|nr:hypothetical protein K5X82_05720 [Prolixibacteraceae bacterium]
MKYIIIIFILVVGGGSIFGQDNQTTLNDLGRIAMRAVVSNEIDGLNESSRHFLEHKLNQLTTRYGMGSSCLEERFILTANVTVLTKDITPTAPPMHAYTLEVSFFIGDGIDGKMYASISKVYKGVGRSETKAYRAALKSIKTNDPLFLSFMEKGKQKIIAYYNSNCDFILKESEMLVSRNEYDDAMANLVAVPEVCKSCYDKAMDQVRTIYQEKVDYEGNLLLVKARSAWSESLDLVSAKKAGLFLSQIAPQAACYAEAELLSQEIVLRVKNLDERVWNLKLKKQQDDVDLKRDEMDAKKHLLDAEWNLKLKKQQDDADLKRAEIDAIKHIAESRIIKGVEENKKYNYKGWL